MSNTTIPSIEVPAPAPTTRPFGLFSFPAASTPAGGRWEMGVWWRSRGCNQVGVTFAPCQVDDPVEELDSNVVCAVTEAPSFTVYARSDESMGGAPLSEKFAAARDALLMGEQFAVEAALWAMLLTATPTPVAAGSAHEALAIVEARVSAVYGGNPVIHMGRYTATLVGLAGALTVVGGKLTTVLNAVVVAGAGYEPIAPDQDEPVDVIGTGAVEIIRGDVNDLGQTFDRDTNSIMAVVERPYIVGWDCAAVRSRFTP